MSGAKKYDFSAFDEAVSSKEQAPSDTKYDFSDFDDVKKKADGQPGGQELKTNTNLPTPSQSPSSLQDGGEKPSWQTNALNPAYSAQQAQLRTGEPIPKQKDWKDIVLDKNLFNKPSASDATYVAKNVTGEKIEQVTKSRANMQTAIDNTTERALKAKGLTAPKNSPAYIKQRKKVEEAIQNGDAAYTIDPATKQPALSQTTGFFESIKNSFISAVNDEGESDEFVNNMDTQQRVDYANKKREEAYALTKEGYVGQIPGGLKGEIGQTIGGAIPFVTKMTAGTIAGAGLVAAAPETGGASLAGIPAVLQFAFTVKDAVNQGGKNEVMRRFDILKQQKPDASDFDLMKEAESGLTSGEITGGITNLVFTAIGAKPAQAIPVIEKSLANTLKNTARGTIKSGVELGTISAGGTAVQEVEAGIEDKKFKKSASEIIDDTVKSFGSGLTTGILLHTATQAVLGSVKLPGQLKSAVKYSLSKENPVELQAILSNNEQLGNVPQGTTEAVMADLNSYNKSLEKTSQDLTPETQASVAGLIQKRDNIMMEMTSKDPTQIDPYLQQVDAINEQIRKITESNDPFAHEVNDVTGQKLDGSIPDITEQEGAKASDKSEEIVPDLTVGDLLDKTGKYKGQDGLFYLDGQAVIFKVEGENKEYELGNINEIKDASVKDFGIEHKESVVTIGDNGELIVRGQEYKNRYSDPLMAINRDANGNVIGVTLETTNGSKRRFKGNTAEDIAYQIHLQEITKNNETRQFEEFINEPEQQQQIDNGTVPEVTSEGTVATDEPIQREKIEPIQQPEQATSELDTQTEVPKQKEEKLSPEETDIEERRKKELDELENTVQLPAIEVLDEKGNVIKTTDKAAEINAKYDAERQALKEKQKSETPEQKEIKRLRAEEQAEYDAMPDPKDEAKRKEIYDKYDKLITPLLKEGEPKVEVPKQKKKQPKGKAAKFVAENLEQLDTEGEGEPKPEPSTENEPVGAVPTQEHTVETIDQVDTTGFNKVQKKNISDVKRVLQAITKLVGKELGKKLKVVIHSTKESAAKAAYDSTIKGGGTEAEAKENMQNQGNRGWWASSDGEIHLNMAEVSSETTLHEGTHPILDAIAKIRPEAIEQFHKQLEVLPQGKEIIDLAKDNYAEYDSQGNVTNSSTVKNEAITDYIAKVADGQIKIDRSNFEKVKNYVVNLLTKLGVMPEKDIRSINDLRELAQMVSEKFAKGQEIEIKDAESYIKKAENLNTSEGIDSDLNLDDIKGESGRGIVLSKKKDILDDDTIKAVKTSIINYKSIPKLKISRTLFYDNTRVGNLEIKNRNTGYAPKVVGKGGFFYSYMPESLKNKAVLAFTSVNQAIQTLKRQMLYPNSVQAIAAQNFLTAHLGNKSTLKALFGEQGSKQLGIFQDAVKKNPEGEKELLNALIESTISVANQKVQSGVNEGKPTNSAIEIKKIIDRNGGNLDNIKSLNDFRDKVLTFKGGDSFGARNILFTEIFQEKPTKITKSTRDSHQIIHYKYGIPTLSEIAEGNNQKQLNNAETGDVIKMVKPYSDPIVYTTDANIYKQYSENPTPEMVENGIKIELLPKEASHESYAFVLKGENVGILDNYIAAPQLYEQNEKIAKVAKKQSFYNVGRMPSDAAPGEYPSEPIPQGVPQFSKTRKPIEWEESKEGKGDPSISARNPIVQEAAAKLKEGKITNEEYRAVASENSPIRPITRFFEPATEDRIKSALSEDKIDKVNIPVEDGKEVGLRLDIPAYKNNNTWVVSVHEGTTNAGKAISYTNVAKIKDVNFGVEPKAALAIAAGVPKTTIGRMFGKWENIEGDTLESKGDNAKKIVQDIVNDPNYVQVGMNPFRHSYFYDRSSDIGRPIKSAEEVIQVGGLVYAKKPVYGDWTDEAYRVKGLLDAGQKPIQFSKTKLPQQKEEIKGTVDGKPVTFVKQPDNVEVVNGFYSPIEKRLTETKIEKQSANKWREVVGKGDEAKFTGVLGWLESLPPTQQVSKSEIQNWMKENRIEINEVVKSGKSDKYNKLIKEQKNASRELDILESDLDNWDDDNYQDSRNKKNELNDKIKKLSFEIQKEEAKTQDTKYENYQLPGKKTNYKEVLITIPSKTNETRLQELIQKKRDKTITEQEETEFQKLDKKLEGNFQSSHYDEPNILAHIRMSTRVDAEGNKVLHIEEFQSDWGQKGKKEGFKKEFNASRYQELQTKVFNGIKQMQKEGKIAEDDMTIAPEKILTAQEAKEFKELKEARETLGKDIPEAPFVTKTQDWTKLAWKVAIKEAVKEGADKITWTTGEQQNDRYDLSKSVDEIGWQKNEDGTYTITPKKSNEVIGQRENMSKITLNRVADLVGKDIAEKIKNEEGKEWQGGNVVQGNLKGEQLTVGGTGMKGFYGSPSEGKLGIVGEVAKSLFKQEPKTTEINTGGKIPLDMTVGQIQELGGVDNVKKLNANTTQYSIDITPEMKAQVESGMPMFSKTRDKKMSDMKDILKEYVDEGKSLEEIKDILKDEFGDYYKDVEGIIDQAHQEMTTTGIKNAVTERERGERGLEEIEVEAKRSFGKVFDDAKQMIANGVANGLTLAAEIIKNPRPLKAEESAVLLIDRMRISNEYNKKNAELLDAQEKGDTAKADIIQSQMEALEDEMDLNDEAARKSGYEQGLGLAARRMLIAQDYSLVTQMNRLKAANGGKEVPKQYQEQIKSLITQLEEANSKLEKVEKMQSGTEKQKEVSKVKPVSRTSEQVATEKQNIKSKIVAKWGQTLARMKAATNIKRSVSPTPVTPQKKAQLESIVKDVNDMVKLYAESGITDLKKIIDDVHQDLVGSLPGLDRVDVEDIVLGKYDTQKPKTSLTPAKIQAQANVRKVKTQIDMLKEELKNKQRGGVEKAVDYLHGWHRFSILSGVPSAAKIGTAALTRGIVTRGENIVGQALSLIPGIRKIAKQAPREGGFSRSAESKAFSSWFDKMTRDDMAEVMKTGISQIDYLYGAKEPKAPKVPEWMEFFGRMHSAIKLLPKRAEFFRSLEMRTEQALKDGKNINDAVVQQELGVAAYNDALRSIFMQDNILTENYQTAIRKYEETQPTTASLLKFLFPIVKVPSNYVAEQSSYIPVVAGVKAITALYKGRKGMTPEQADFFMRALKKGSIGTAFIALGFFNPVNFGGYYTGKRKKDDLEAGDIELFGVKLPHFMLHTPLLEMLQVGATMRRAAESQLAKGEEPSKTLGMYTGGIPAVLKGQLTQIPFIGTGERTMKLLENKTSDGIKEFANSMVQSVVEPQLMQNLADYTDTEDGKTVKRESKGLVEKLKEGAPGFRKTLKQDKSKFTDKEYEEFSNITEKGLNIPELNKRTTYKVKIDTEHPDGHMTEEEYDKFIPVQKEYVKDAYKRFYGSHKSDFDRLQKMIEAVPETPEEKAKMNALKNAIQNKIDAVHNEAIKAAKRKIGLTQK